VPLLLETADDHHPRACFRGWMRHEEHQRTGGKRAKAKVGGGAPGVALVADKDDQGEVTMELGDECDS
jgi:hypothetical protein